MFQYIICCWFKIFKKLSCFNTLYVVGSKCILLLLIKYLACFNTLYVVGSTSKKQLKAKEESFKYIICCWFKNSNNLKNGVSFNTLYVVGSKTIKYGFFFRYVLIHYICCWFKINKTLNSICFTLYVGSNNFEKLFQYIICCWFNHFFWFKRFKIN